MRYLILSDIHANLQALEAVVEHAKGNYNRVLCCGDLVGYGADPNGVVDWVREHAYAAIRGNHDKVAIGIDDMEDYNPAAILSTMWTRKTLTPASIEYLKALPQGPIEIDDFSIVHGSPRDEDEYIVSEYDASAARPAIRTRVTFFGHTHLQGGFFFRRNSVREIDPIPRNRSEATVAVDENSWFLINPGSVGQPRDKDPRAAYAIYSQPDRLVTYYRVEYDIEKAQARILEANLPEPLALRLSIGS